MLPNDGSLSDAPTSIVHSRSQGGRHRACAEVGFVHGYPVVNRSFLMTNGKWFDVTKVPTRLEPEYSQQPPTLRAELRARSLVPANNFAFVVPIGERLVFEWPLTRRGRVEGVFKSESRDMGQTWTDPVISTDAEIYELGKYEEEQSFVGRPLRYNGDPVEPWTD